MYKDPLKPDSGTGRISGGTPEKPGNHMPERLISIKMVTTYQKNRFYEHPVKKTPRNHFFILKFVLL